MEDMVIGITCLDLGVMEIIGVIEVIGEVIMGMIIIITKEIIMISLT
jgi:hypothetical protein